MREGALSSLSAQGGQSERKGCDIHNHHSPSRRARRVSPWEKRSKDGRREGLRVGHQGRVTSGRGGPPGKVTGNRPREGEQSKGPGAGVGGVGKGTGEARGEEQGAARCG